MSVFHLGDHYKGYRLYLTCQFFSKLRSSIQKFDDSSLFDSDVKAIWEEHTASEGLLVRDENKVHLLENGNKRTPSQVLDFVTKQQAKLLCISGGDELRVHNVCSEGGLWRVVKKGYQLGFLDVIRFGRFRMRVCELNGQFAGGESYVQEIGICDFCCRNDGLVISICNCKKNKLHTECYKQWFQKKYISLDNFNNVSIQWKRLECDSCKKQLSYNFKVDGVQHTLIQKPKTPYMILEMMSKDSNSLKGLFIIHGDVKIGRITGSNVKVLDNSISREHASIRVIQDQFILSDLASKFGTMIYIEDSFTVPINEGEYEFQAMQTRIRLTISKEGQNSFSPLQASQLSTVFDSPLMHQF